MAHGSTFQIRDRLSRLGFSNAITFKFGNRSAAILIIDPPGRNIVRHHARAVQPETKRAIIQRRRKSEQ
jgi:hypothetical protein